MTAVLLVLSVTAWAQTPNRSHNVLGAPVYYDTLGNVRGNATPGDTTWHLPKHHYFNRLSNDFCSSFLEIEGLLGFKDAAIGINYTYLPERWGGYGSLLFGINHVYLSAGAALRLSNNGSLFDWQLYGGPVYGGRLGGELGFRLAMPRRDGDFCWTSLSTGMIVMPHRVFFTCGLSLELAAMVSAYWIWW